MPGAKSVFMIMLEPTLIDYTLPFFVNFGVDAKKVSTDIRAAQRELVGLGNQVELFFVDFSDTSFDMLASHIQQKKHDVFLIGSGLRTIPTNVVLFEKIINLVHQHAPEAKLCFNTMPEDIAKAVGRWE